MEGTMIRLLLLACLALAAILLFQSDLSATGYKALMNTRLAQEDSENAQVPNPSTTSDTGSSDDSGKPARDQD